MSAASCSSHFLAADLILSLLARVPVLLVTHLTRLWVPPHVPPVCCLLSADFSLALSLLARMWVLPLIYPITFYQPLSWFGSMWVALFICHLYCMLICLCFPGCELLLVHAVHCLLISLLLSFVSMWVLHISAHFWCYFFIFINL